MYGFKTKDGQQARIDPTTVRAIIPAGLRTGYVKLVLDGGHAVTVEGETEAIYSLLNQYRLQPITTPPPATPQSDTNEVDAFLARVADSTAKNAAQPPNED